LSFFEGGGEAFVAVRGEEFVIGAIASSGVDGSGEEGEEMAVSHQGQYTGGE
jgi:hypothetical protein